MLAAVLLVSLTACAQVFPRNCPAIGWTNTVEVDASAYGNDAFVQLCVLSRCSVAPGEREMPSDDASVPFRGEGDTFQLGMTAPEEVLIRVYSVHGTLVAEKEHEIDWTHSTDPCGGPSIASILVET